MNLYEIPLSCASLQLSHGLDKRRALDITHCASQFNDTHIGRLVRVIDWNTCNALNPVLDGICEVRNHLDRLTKIVTATFPLDDMLVDLARRDVVLAGKGDIKVTFIVAEIEVNFSAVVEDKAFTVPGRMLASQICQRARMETKAKTQAEHRHLRQPRPHSGVHRYKEICGTVLTLSGPLFQHRHSYTDQF